MSEEQVWTDELVSAARKAYRRMFWRVLWRGVTFQRIRTREELDAEFWQIVKATANRPEEGKNAD